MAPDAKVVRAGTLDEKSARGMMSLSFGKLFEKV